MAAVERDLPQRIGSRRDGGEDVLPNAPRAPAREPIVDRLMRSILARTVLPAASDFLHMHDAAQYPPIIVALGTTLVGRQMRLDLRPLGVVEPKQIRAHRLGLPSG